MSKPDQHYSTDSFQLEQNLHKIKQELILMLEEFEKRDCVVCLQLKCRCIATPLKKDANLTSETGHGDIRGKDTPNTPNKAPKSDLLRKQKFEKEVEVPKKGYRDIKAWIEASRIAQKAKHDRLPDTILASIKRSWGDPTKDFKNERFLQDLKKERIVFDTKLAAANAVEVFFNSFKAQPAVTAGNMAYISNLTAAYNNRKSRSFEYTYF